MEVNVDHLDYIVELYNIPEEYRSKDLVEILREYRRKHLLIRWVNDNTALGVFDTAENANNAIRGLSHHAVKCRSLAEASHESIIKASTHRRHETEAGETTTGGNPSRNVRGRGRCRGNFGRERSAYSTESTRFETRKQKTELNPDVFDILNHSLQELDLSGSIDPDQKRKPFLMFQNLVTLSTMEDDPEGILLELGHSQSGFQELLENENFNNDYLCYILKIIAIINKSTDMNSSRRQVFQLFQDTFIDRLYDILNGITLKLRSTETLWQNKSQLSELCTICAQAVTAVMSVIRSSPGKYKSIIMVLKEIQESFQLNDTLLSEIEGCEEILKSVKEEMDLVQRTSKEKKSNQRGENRSPPDHFRDISILPCLSDLRLDEKPFIRANKCKGKYQDLETYLDVQFRLLREDYMQPLRSGISKYKDHVKQGLSTKELRDIRLYHSVQIIGPVCSISGINYLIEFDVSRFKSINWADSRRLLPGSLLCLSCDHFETHIYATVMGGTSSNLKEGLLEVRIETTEDADVNTSSDFVMAETTAFFEAYKHVLAGLQEIDETLPLQRYLVNCEPSVKPPMYLLHSSSLYDFSSILRKKTAVSKYPVLDPLRWPQPYELELDESQFEALKMAITKEIAIIQGPPGTGKTFIGLMITKLLLENKLFWNNGFQGKPILVVCYTNHALDQFLQGISRFCRDGIVRIGGRCKDEALDEYVLNNIKKKLSQEKLRSRSIVQNERECYSIINEYKSCISNANEQLLSSRATIFTLRRLEAYMTESQKGSFKQLVKRLGEGSESTCIAQWLGIKPFPQQNIQSKDEHLRKKLEWEFFVVSDIKEMADTEKDGVDDVWQLTLHERATLYKSWVSEAKANTNKSITESMDRTNMLRLDKLVMGLDQNLQSIAALHTLVSKEKTRIQLHMVESGGGSSEDPLLDWLALDGKAESTEKINEAMRVAENILDLEEKDFDDDREVGDGFNDKLPTDYNTGSNTGTANTESWDVAFRKRKMKFAVKDLLSKARGIEKAEACNIDNILEIPIGKRRDLYKFWIDEYRRHLRNKLLRFETKYSSVCKKLQEIRDMETIQILRKSVFIGMTTTGAAKYRHIVQKVRPRIVIVEEAAEVLESHIVTSLNKDCQHLILIGDHKQLRPSTTVFELAKKYHLDISLFERMVMNDIPCVTLRKQHRMRPEISELLRYKNLYPQLQDNSNVTEYPDVKGVDGNFRFICHTEDESRTGESSSYSNIFEARYIVALTKYLLEQGYESDRITILTPYMGQVLLLMNLRKNITQLKNVLITAIDNYQGEENDIILLSLVRSSQSIAKGLSKNPIGFVGIENRICVALSRAKIGFYVIGNFDLFKIHSDMWKYMTSVMHERNRMTTALTLRCQNHPERSAEIEKIEDFRKVPEGGCQLPCGQHLPCGHICPRACHVLDKNHTLFKCPKPCTKICQFGHPCTKRCSEECGNCNILVDKILPLCKHKATIPCHIEPLRYSCTKLCPNTLKCGHPCQKSCRYCRSTGYCEDLCGVTITKKLQCGHEIEAACSEDVSEKVCQMPCIMILSCSHHCSGTCIKCFCGKIHEKCNERCQKTLPCGHKCSFSCSEICPPCPRKCKWKCSHSLVCKNSCSSACIKCEEKCTFGCRHRKCTRSCHEDCDVTSCNEPCTKKLECGHTCNGLCGEKCLCVTCADAATQSRLSDINDDTIRYIKLPDCSCIVEVLTLDTTMKNPEFSRTDMYKRCPIEGCRKPITSLIWRYANILKHSRKTMSRRNEAVFGPSDSCIEKAQMLTIDLKLLKRKGLSQDGAAILEKMIYNSTPCLDDVRTTMDKLIDVLEVTHTEGFRCIAGQLSQKWFASPLHPKLLMERLLTVRDVSTRQFWIDIDNEIQRIRLYSQVNDPALNSARVKLELIVPGVIASATRFLAKKQYFDDIKFNTVAELCKSLNDIKEGKSVRKTQLDVLKEKLDSYN